MRIFPSTIKEAIITVAATEWIVKSALNCLARKPITLNFSISLLITGYSRKVFPGRFQFLGTAILDLRMHLQFFFHRDPVCEQNVDDVYGSRQHRLH